MKKTISILGALVLFLSSTSILFAQVKSDYDKETDFSKYKTYTFEGWEKDSGKKLTDFDKKRITDALKSEFSARGMEVVTSDGDVEITLYIVINNKTSTTAYTDYTGGMGYGGMGVRRGWGMGYGGMGLGSVSSTTSYSENDYKEGTFVIDMYDNTGKNLIWQGIITSVVKEKSSKRDKSIPKKIKKLMKEYPIKPTK